MIPVCPKLAARTGPERSPRFGLLLVQALLDVGGAIPRQHPGRIGAVRAFLDLELFGAPLYRGLAILRRDLVWIDQLLSKARRKWNA